MAILQQVDRTHGSRVGRFFEVLGERLVEGVFVFGSMYLSFLFGWNLADGHGMVAWVVGGLCACAAFMVAKNAYRAGVAWRHGNMPWLYINLGMLTIFAIPNAWFDYSSAAVIRDVVSVQTDNVNATSKLAKDEVKRLESRRAEITGRTQWQSTYLAPAAYDSLISAAQLVRDNEVKRGGCGRICETKTKELAELEANKANAVARVGLVAELKQIDGELEEARKNSSAHGEKSNPAKAAVTSIIGWWHFDKMDDKTIYWGANGIQLIITTILQFGMIFCGMYRGYHDAMRGHAIDGSRPVDITPVAPPAARLLSAEPAVEARSREAMGDAGRYVETRSTVVRETVDGRKMALSPNMAALLDEMRTHAAQNQQKLQTI